MKTQHLSIRSFLIDWNLLVSRLSISVSFDVHILTLHHRLNIPMLLQSLPSFKTISLERAASTLLQATYTQKQTVQTSKPGFTIPRALWHVKPHPQAIPQYLALDT
jgi:hypothetical protein